MVTLQDSRNRSVLAFNQGSSIVMKAICDPFFKQFNLTKFTYCRSFYSGERLYLSSHLDWVKHYIAHNFQNDIQHMIYYKPPEDINYALWSGFDMDKVFSAFYDFDIWHGFTVYERDKEYIDLFDFATHRDNYYATDLYLNNQHLFHDFIKIFKQKATELIDTSDHEKLLLPIVSPILTDVPPNLLVEAQKVKNFIDKTM